MRPLYRRHTHQAHWGRRVGWAPLKFNRTPDDLRKVFDIPILIEGWTQMFCLIPIVARGSSVINIEISRRSKHLPGLGTASSGGCWQFLRGFLVHFRF